MAHPFVDGFNFLKNDRLLGLSEFFNLERVIMQIYLVRFHFGWEGKLSTLTTGRGGGCDIMVTAFTCPCLACTGIIMTYPILMKLRFMPCVLIGNYGHFF
jgi:hypothetical protein